jgi:hypothetical protein
MAEFEVLLQPYQLESSHASDDGEDCITIDINNLSNVLGSMLDNLGELKELTRVRSAVKLYILGKWQSNAVQSPVQWCEAVEKICELIKEMTNLVELT